MAGCILQLILLAASLKLPQNECVPLTCLVPYLSAFPVEGPTGICQKRVSSASASLPSMPVLPGVQIVWQVIPW